MPATFIYEQAHCKIIYFFSCLLTLGLMDVILQAHFSYHSALLSERFNWFHSCWGVSYSRTWFPGSFEVLQCTAGSGSFEQVHQCYCFSRMHFCLFAVWLSASDLKCLWACCQGTAFRLDPNLVSLAFLPPASKCHFSSERSYNSRWKRV